ncbi:MAG: hypothetical protein IAC58_00655 [Firmicutes bacterium]|uniref:Uncharacterized protein n=1 Tax=Candidatus Onthovivens merdipullorum TaxID=2840889 RepID=A0A9D9DGB3_9BACL|nr:hypothetical protein [Candidatus Onthovivens merdipullorum]
MRGKISVLFISILFSSFSLNSIKNKTDRTYDTQHNIIKEIRIDENSDTTLKIALEGTVLLKNDYNVLPLKPTDDIAITNYNDAIFGGGVIIDILISLGLYFLFKKKKNVK